MLREGNQAADYLAKLGANFAGNDCVWETPPMGMEHILLVDVSGILFLR